MTTTASKTGAFAKLLDEQFGTVPKVGDTLKGLVLSVGRNEVRIDIDGLRTGVIRGQQLFAESSEYRNLKESDEVEATVTELENENGELELSFRTAGHARAWNKLEELRKSGQVVQARIKEANKGGLMVDLDGMDAFLPVSQLSGDHYPRVAGGDKNKILEKLREFVGQDLAVKVIDVNEKEEKLIVSEKTLGEEAKSATPDKFKVGVVVEGEVSAITAFGAFVKFDGVEGLVHISELAWQRIDHPKDVVRIGDMVKAEIIQIDGKKIFLSMKRLMPDPWKNIAAKYSIGQKVTGKIVKVNPYGLFVELDPEIQGLAHVSELSNEQIEDIAKKFAIGDNGEFEIVSIEADEHRLGLRIPGVKPRAKDKESKDKEPKEGAEAKPKAKKTKAAKETEPVAAKAESEEAAA
ncbi:MAG: S1 RNA-binding domain-containing protein [Candidatus Magasanikbacteria bacterium]|nr:S1 RNA-binding domain-containing protein [Candidatus Magasanikbacteria bacterium]